MEDDGRSKIQHMVQEFHLAKGHVVDAPLIHQLMIFRLRLISEEFSELVKAMDLKDPIAVVDALGDLEYVINGTAVTFGIPLQAIVEEIHASNMTKGENIQGKPAKDNGFSPPDIEGVLKKYGRYDLLHADQP